MCLFMVAREICAGLGGEGISSVIEGTILSATDSLCDLVTCHQPVPAFSFCRNAVPLSLIVGGEVHKPAPNVADPPGERHCTCLRAHRGWGEFFFYCFLLKFCCWRTFVQKTQPTGGSTSDVQRVCSEGCYPFRNLFALAFVSWQGIYVGRV